MDAPADPRRSWALPAPGQMARTAEPELLVTRVLAPNPSPMTLDGTNTYVVGAPGSGQAVVVDPGPDDDAHLAAVQEVLAARDAEVVGVLVTHHHGDHAEAALPWAGRFGVQVQAASRDVTGPDGRLLADGDTVTLAGTSLDVVATPGHCADHLAFRLETGSVLVGDHVLGRGTSVVTHPEGDVLAYLDSLRRVHRLGPAALYCGHGPELTEDVGAVLEFYAAHRAHREWQLLDALLGASGVGGARKTRTGHSGDGRTVDELVAHVYAEVPTTVWPAAAQSTRATLAKLSAQGRVVRGAGDSWRLA